MPSLLPRRPVLALACLALAAPLVTACASPVPVEPAPYAADPDCARVMLAAPTTVGGLPMLTTTSQATAAYGKDYPIIVRCGVEPPGPSELPCVEVEAGSVTVGWLLEERADDWLAVSFGLSPAVEATIPRLRADQAVGDLLIELSPSASLAPPNGLSCR